MNETSMSNMKNGETGTVVCQKSPENIRRRLQDIGIIEGAKVRCVCQSPLGDPKAYCVRGAVVAIRAKDSSDIIIKLDKE